ncbi:MAG: hypothetical protein K6B65_03190 [Bacilli bacterium]|nr:hypothetical protein [Bacilli bacterium]
MKKTKTLIGLVATICAIVAIFTLFAAAFAGVNNYPSGRGSVYQIMFGNYQGYDAVPGLIAAWAVLLAASLTLLIGSFLPSKLGGIVLGLGALLSLTAGILFFFGPQFYLAVINNGQPVAEENPTLGYGLIISAIFAILGAIMGLFAARTAMKA